MNVQHFVGANMRDALSQVRRALGEDALILETQESSRGIEVSAVTEKPGDQALTRSEESASSAHESAHKPAIERQRMQAVNADSKHEIDSVLQRAADAPANDKAVGAVAEEMKSIRSLVESHLAHVGWNETTLSSPLKASVMRNLSAFGLAPDIVNELMKHLDPEQLRGNTWSQPMKLLIEKLPVADPGELNAGRIAIVGPTGAGKTTTIAKLAARYAISSSAEKLAVVSLDNHRLGSGEQIDALGRLLGIAVRRPVGDRGIADLSQSLDDSELALIDTVGLGQYDTRIQAQLGRLGSDVRTLLVLPANLEHDVMQDVVDAYAVCKPVGIVLTKVDEAATLGAAISVIFRSGIPLVLISDGQRIPEDLRIAAESQSWLIKHGVELMRRRRIAVSNRYMAENFFGVGQEEHMRHV